MLAIVFLSERVVSESPDLWHLLHIAGSSGFLLCETLVGIHFELLELCGYDARRGITGGCQYRAEGLRHECCHRVMQLLLFFCAACFIAVGPSTTAKSNGTDLFVIGASRVLCISGGVLGTARLTVGCFKHQFRRREQRRMEEALVEASGEIPLEENSR